MKPDELEAKMRRFEEFHSLRVLPGCYVVIRVDGRAFHTLVEWAKFRRPFDEQFHEAMVRSTRVLAKDLNAIYAHTESDEASFLLGTDFDGFDREVEKLVSISAATMASNFLLALRFDLPWHEAAAPAFDSRLVVLPRREDVVDYFRWRQADAHRCALNGWCYWTLRGEGKSERAATSELEGKGDSFKNELLWKHGINFNALPAWQRRGVGLYLEDFQKKGYNPKKKEEVTVTRRIVKVETELPTRDAYGEMILKLIHEAEDKG